MTNSRGAEKSKKISIYRFAFYFLRRIENIFKFVFFLTSCCCVVRRKFQFIVSPSIWSKKLKTLKIFVFVRVEILLLTRRIQEVFEAV